MNNSQLFSNWRPRSISGKKKNLEILQKSSCPFLHAVYRQYLVCTCPQQSLDSPGGYQPSSQWTCYQNHLQNSKHKWWARLCIFSLPSYSPVEKRKGHRVTGLPKMQRPPPSILAAPQTSSPFVTYFSSSMFTRWLLLSHLLPRQLWWRQPLLFNQISPIRKAWGNFPDPNNLLEMAPCTICWR